MAAGFNTYADITTYVQTIYEDALFAARETGFMSNLVTRFSADGMAARTGKEYPKATVSAIGESDDLSSQVWKPSDLSTLTPAEYGAQFFLTDQRLESDPEGYRADAALELGTAMGEAINTALLGNFSSLTGGTVGVAGTAITWGHFFAMRSQLKAQKAPGPYVCVMHDYQWHVLAKAASLAASTQPVPSWLTDTVLMNWYTATVAGVSIFTTSDISIDTGVDAYCAVFSPAALALDTRRAPRIEPERDASRRGWELNLSCVYAHGVWRPKFGVQGIFDAAAPTS